MKEKVLNLGKKIRELSIKNNRRRILKNYYAKEIKAGKTYRALLLDRSLFKIITFIILGLILNVKTESFLLSFYLSALSVFFISKSISKYRKSKLDKKINEINEDLKKRKLIREFSRLNKGDFVKYMKDLLEAYYKTEFNQGDFFDLEGKIANERYGIKCIKISMDERVILRELEDFNRDLIRQNMDEGILITNSYFRDEVKEEASLILHDFDSIILMLKDQDRYPSHKDMEDYIIDRFLNKRINIKKDILQINFKKALQLYGLFAIFYLLSPYVKYPLYYKTIVIILFSVITMIIGYKISEQVKERDFSLFNNKIKVRDRVGKKR